MLFRKLIRRKEFAMLRFLLAIALISGLVACAGPNPPPGGRNLVLSEGVLALLKSDESITLGDPRIRCETSRALGSSFKRQFCMTREEFEIQREWSLRDAYGAGHDRVN